MPARQSFQSDERSKRIDDFLTKIEQCRANMGDYYTEMEKCAEAYAGDQELKDNRPNSRVNIVNANIEGQVSALVDQNMAIVCKGEGPSDHSFARWAEVGLDWTLRKNKIKRGLKTHERRRELFGWAWLKLDFDNEAFNGFGLVRFTFPPLQNIFVDQLITDPTRIPEARYIAEVVQQSKEWAEKQDRYRDKAKNIKYGGSDKSPIFQKERTLDDEDAYWHIYLWTMTDGILRLEEFSDDGVHLYDSFEDKAIGEKPFHRYNRYPYFLTIMYPEEGKLFGFGDGKLLRPLQDMLNDLYDQIRKAARPNRVLFDPESEVDLEVLDNGDDTSIPCLRPNETVKVIEMGKVNEALWRLISNVHTEIQRVTRFSDLMLGQKAVSDTATEAAIQQQQGSMATDSKKGDLQDTMEEACAMALDMMIEDYQGGRWFRLDENKEDYAWINFAQLDNVPVMKPPTEAYTRQFQANNPDMKVPQWMQVEDQENNTKSVDLDVEINFGQGLPKNKAFLWQMLEKLAGLNIANQPVVFWEEMRKFIKDMLGLPLEEEENMLMKQIAAQQAQVQAAAGGVPMQGAEVPGLSPGGSPMMSNLPIPQQPGGVL